jgi:hypothetical protein
MVILLLVVAFIATSAMTIFSYVISASFKELYKEPLLLKYILVKINVSVSDNLKEVLAWVIHYAIGFLFVLSYYFLWKLGIIHLTVLNGLYIGAISGIIAIISWIIMFRLSGFNRKATDKGYYTQLFIAHIIFGIAAILVLSFLISEM